MKQRREISKTWRIHDELRVIKREVQRLRNTVEALQDALTRYMNTQHPFVSEFNGRQPAIRGTNIAVQTVAELAAGGDSVDDILAAYPQLSAAQVYDALSYHHEHRQEPAEE